MSTAYPAAWKSNDWLGLGPHFYNKATTSASVSVPFAVLPAVYIYSSSLAESFTTLKSSLTLHHAPAIPSHYSHSPRSCFLVNCPCYNLHHSSSTKWYRRLLSVNLTSDIRTSFISYCQLITHHTLPFSPASIYRFSPVLFSPASAAVDF